MKKGEEIRRVWIIRSRSIRQRPMIWSPISILIWSWCSLLGLGVEISLEPHSHLDSVMMRDEWKCPALLFPASGYESSLTRVPFLSRVKNVKGHWAPFPCGYGHEAGFLGIRAVTFGLWQKSTLYILLRVITLNVCWYTYELDSRRSREAKNAKWQMWQTDQARDRLPDQRMDQKV